ncbi:rho GTPase-activating protein gacJ-like [Anopheles ziemanni]|uniref:rho GTPase-activating protein gacJ-like n=1 Tax=Anopheles coustani TaxID=139045 RepID=UPI002659E9C8|nr:rho GTPase-activating protein gacJ-like [Anopheles coustani]XP_058174433.1 rho GTPase-activating protein gacJ-like [Anopheles ziemanni]
MQSLTVCALALLLVSPALARPNLLEPIYLRRRSNPLEIVEESVETSTLLSSQPAAVSQTSTEKLSTGTTPTSGSGTTSTAGSTSTHQPSLHSFKRPELLKTKIGTSGFVVSTSTKVLTGGASAASGHSSAKTIRPQPANAGVASGEAKANDQLTLFDRYSGHAGVAEPMTDEEYQNELHRATERVLPRTTTPREGLSTWVLLSGSDSSELQGDSTSTTRKAPIAKSTTTTTTSTTTAKPIATKRYQPTTRRIMPTTTPRVARTTTPSTSTGSEEKKDKFNKPTPKLKVATTTLKPVIVKKVKKPPVTTTTTTTTTTTPKPTTTTTTTTTTEMVITEQSPSTVANDLAAAVTEDSSVESSTFLIMEPKDALFDLPEDRSPAKTAPAAIAKGKKPTRKPNAKSPAGTKKKPANKKNRKPEVKDGVPGEKKPAANKNKPVSTQIINYLSREVMPTVGVGLVGLVMAAGLASYFLGSPLGALRRSDDRKDDLYYSNYEEYAGPDGQNEEDVFGKLIAGMPDRAYYRNNAVRRRTQQPVRTGHQYYHVQPYSANKYPHITYRNRAYAGAPNGQSAPETMYTNINRQAQVQPSQAKSQNEFYYNTPPTPYYPTRSVAIEAATRQPAPVYSSTYVPSTSSTTIPTPSAPLSTPEAAPAAAADPIVEPEHEMMPHPEAYSAEHSPEHHAHYVVGSSYGADGMDMYGSVPEHGPRRKRDVQVDDADFDNEIDVDEDRVKDDSSVVVEGASSPATASEEVTDATTDSTGEMETTTAVTTGGDGHRYTWGDFIRNTVERKVAMGIHFLQHVTMDFQRYLNGVQNHFQHPPHNPTNEHRRQH